MHSDVGGEDYIGVGSEGCVKHGVDSAWKKPVIGIAKHVVARLGATYRFGQCSCFTSVGGECNGIKALTPAVYVA